MKKKILIVDDEEIIRRFLKRILSAEYDLMLLENINQASGVMLAFKPDLLITDLKLPDGNGQKVIERFRASFPGRGIIVITGSPTPHEEFKNLQELGILLLIQKPFDIEELRIAVKKALEKSDL